MKELDFYQQLRLDLIEKCNDLNWAKEAYNFILGSNPSSDARLDQTGADGVYLVYSDGHSELFNSENPKEGIVNVAFRFGCVSLKLHPKNIKYTALTLQRGGDESRFISDIHKAVLDMNGVANTESLKVLGLCFDLPEGYYVPALGQLTVMYMMMYPLNEALTYAGHDILEDLWYWSSTEHSAGNAWSKNLGDGGVNAGGKATYSNSIRAVTAF